MLRASAFASFPADGFVVTPHVFSAPEIAGIREECERLLSRTARWAVLGAAAQSPRLLAFAKHVAFREICAFTIGSDVDLFFDAVLFKPAGGGKELRWHQDAAYGRTEPAYVSCWVPLSGGSTESGGLWVSPGSHLGGAVRHARGRDSEHEYAGRVALTIPKTSEPLDLSPGQIAVLHSEILHRSGPNTTGTDRLAAQFGFVGASTRLLDQGLPDDHRLPLFRSAREGAADQSARKPER